MKRMREMISDRSTPLGIHRLLTGKGVEFLPEFLSALRDYLGKTVWDDADSSGAADGLFQFLLHCYPHVGLTEFTCLLWCSPLDNIADAAVAIKENRLELSDLLSANGPPSLSVEQMTTIARAIMTQDKEEMQEFDKIAAIQSLYSAGCNWLVSHEGLSLLFKTFPVEEGAATFTRYARIVVPLANPATGQPFSSRQLCDLMHPWISYGPLIQHFKSLPKLSDDPLLKDVLQELFINTRPPPDLTLPRELFQLWLDSDLSNRLEEVWEDWQSPILVAAALSCGPEVFKKLGSVATAEQLNFFWLNFLRGNTPQSPKEYWRDVLPFIPTSSFAPDYERFWDVRLYLLLSIDHKPFLKCVCIGFGCDADLIDLFHRIENVVPAMFDSFNWDMAALPDHKENLLLLWRQILRWPSEHGGFLFRDPEACKQLLVDVAAPFLESGDAASGRLLATWARNGYLDSLAAEEGFLWQLGQRNTWKSILASCPKLSAHLTDSARGEILSRRRPPERYPIFMSLDDALDLPENDCLLKQLRKERELDDTFRYVAAPRVAAVALAPVAAAFSVAPSLPVPTNSFSGFGGFSTPAAQTPAPSSSFASLTEFATNPFSDPHSTEPAASTTPFSFGALGIGSGSVVENPFSRSASSGGPKDPPKNPFA